MLFRSRFPAGEVYLLDVADPRRCEKQNFVAWIDERLNGLVEQGFGSAGDDDLRARVLQGETIPVIVRDGVLQLGYA